jgi:Na+/melibiose symporter-like transporter
MTPTQNYANHTRVHALFHYFLAPGSLLLIVLAIINLVRHSSQLDAWIVMLGTILFFVAVFLLRSYPLKVQDRVIRLEERLRLQELLPDALVRRVSELTEAQLIALRFASDSEVPALVEKALVANMPAREMKKQIVHWRADSFRV